MLPETTAATLDLSTISDEALWAEIGKRRGLRRKSYSGGKVWKAHNPDTLRCRCAACTAKRADAAAALVAQEHSDADGRCGRVWECSCGACRQARALGFVPARYPAAEIEAANAAAAEPTISRAAALRRFGVTI
jgi:hypothetical protein